MSRRAVGKVRHHGIFLSESVLEGASRIDTSITHRTAFGCDSIVHITVQIAATDFTLYLPNAITPSKADGLNDVYQLLSVIPTFSGNRL